jgi:manganese transport protein
VSDSTPQPERDSRTGGPEASAQPRARAAALPPNPARSALPGEARVLAAAERSLAGERRGLQRVLPFLGPAFIASVAYVDPGNFATNVAGGARYGYMLLWVILASNLMAMLVQSMSAKLGIATGRNLAEVCRDRYPYWARVTLWLLAEGVAMATDLAEFVGASIALNLLFGIPLLAAAGVTGVVAFAVLALQAGGFRRLEGAIAGFVLAIVLGFFVEMVLSHPDGAAVAKGLVTPRFDGSDSVLLAAGILGATVMPHVIYLHSALTQQRIVGESEAERRRIFRFELVDVVIAMTIAGAINVSMLVLAAAAFHAHGLTGVGNLGPAFHALRHTVGNHADTFFGLALLASGLSSSSVGTMAGQVVMQGFIQRQVPLMLRRLATMVPALVVIATGVNASHALVLSQVVLSFGIPFALIPLLWFCRDRALMGVLVNRRSTTAMGAAVVVMIVALNVFLLWQLSAG